MLIRTLLSIPLQILCKIILNFKVTVISIKDSVDKFMAAIFFASICSFETACVNIN